MSKKYFKQLSDFMKENPGLTKKEAAQELKKANNTHYEMTCPGCGMAAKVISDSCGKCGMSFNLAE